MENKQESIKKVTPAGLIHLFIVYIVWGSTYLAIRVGVREGAGFGPFWFGASRVLVAGTVLILWGALRGRNVLPSKKDLFVLAATGLLLWIGGNGLVLIAERQVDSNLAALIVASTPIWVAMMETAIDSKVPSGREILSLVVGFLGIVTLSFPVLSSGVRADFLSILALFLASVSWSTGLVLQTKRPVNLDRGVSSGFQQLFGGIFFTIIALFIGESLPTPTTEAWLAWGYLVVFGSIIAFTSFVSALQILPTRFVTTYAYVNPVIAVLLGWLILGESVTPWTIAGGVMVLIGVTGIYQASAADRSNQDENEDYGQEKQA